jgi:hypothetical protein
VQSLPGGGQGHAPTDEDGRSQVEGAVELEVDVAGIEEALMAECGAERGGCSGHEEVPAETQKAEGDEPEGGQQERRGEGEDGPGGAGAEGSDAGLGEHGLGEGVGGTETGAGGGRGGGGREATGLLFGGKVGEVVGEFREIEADVAGSDAGAEEALAEFGETGFREELEHGGFRLGFR